MNKKVLAFGIAVVLAILLFALLFSRVSEKPGPQPKPLGNIPYQSVNADAPVKIIIDSSQKLDNGNLVVKFHHSSGKDEPVSIIGAVRYQLSKATAKPNEEITLTVFEWSTEYFEIEIGKARIGFGRESESLDADTPVLGMLEMQGINRADVILEKDYGRRLTKAEKDAKKARGDNSPDASPFSKIYRDTKSGKMILVSQGLPMVDDVGMPIEVGWQEQGQSGRFTEKNNLFKATVNGNNVELTVKNDQPDGRKQNDQLTFQPQLFLDGVEQTAGDPTLLAIDPVNSNYANNVLEWDYGIAKRRLRLIEGHVLGSWVFPKNPNGDTRIVYNQRGDYKLKLGQYKFNDDEERVSAQQFNNAIYPFTVQDSATYYPGTATGLQENYNTGDDTQWGLESAAGYWAGQTFTPSEAHTVTSVKMKAYRIGFPGTITVSIRATAGDLPTGSDICSGTTDGNTLTTSSPGEWRQITLSSCPSLSDSTKYAIVARNPSGNADNRAMWRYDLDASTYSGGDRLYSYDSGSNWTIAGVGTDFMFEEYETTTSVDGSAGRDGTAGWTDAHDGAGTTSQDLAVSGYIARIFGTGSTTRRIARSFFLFDTGSLPNNAALSAATLSLYGTSRLSGGSVNIVLSTPASNIAIVDSDYQNIGAVTQSSDILTDNWSVTGYNDFSLNDLTKVSLTGITKLGARDNTNDIPNVAPGVGEKYASSYFSEQGTGYQPKLVVTYYSPLANGEVCTTDGECLSDKCRLGPNNATKYCTDATKTCGQSGGLGYDAGEEISNDECQTDGTWLCNGGYYNPSGFCIAAGSGYYSAEDSDTRAQCSAGYYGSSTTSSVSTCDGICSAGYYCPAGSTSATQNECGLGNYCPAGSGSATACAAGTYGSSTTLATSSCSGQCSAGYYGSSTGQTASTCNGLCSASYYCPAGSTSSTQNACPAGTTSNPGSASADDCYPPELLQWTSYSSGPCNLERRIYCFEK